MTQKKIYELNPLKLHTDSNGLKIIIEVYCFTFFVL